MKTILAAFFLVACGADPKTPAAAQMLAGHWTSAACETAGQNHFKRDFTMTDATWSLAFELYADDQCTQKIAVVDIGGGYSIGAASQTVAGANDAEFDFGTRTVTPLAQPFADFLGQSKCGNGTWTVGGKQDILAAGCAPIGAYPLAMCKADFDVVKVDGTRLYFGNRPADNDMCTADKRPKALTSAAVVKQ